MRPARDPIGFKRLKVALRRVAYDAVRWVADRVDVLRPRPAPFDGRVPAPEWVCLETTRYCNLSCRMCLPFIDGITVTGPHMAVEKFRLYAEQIFPAAKTFQPSVSGEPLMSKDLLEMVAVARRWGVQMEVTTNGTLLTPKIVDAILPILDTIGISFDGATKETFEHIREGARFERVVGNVRYLVERARQMPEAERPRIGLAATIMERNVRELGALVALEHELGLDFLSVTHVFPATEEMRKQSLFHHQELAKKHLAEAEALARRLGVALLIGPLDQIIATTATNGERMVSLQDGVVPGFEEKKINWTLDEPRPASPRGADASVIAERRAEREAASPLKKRRARRRFPKRDAPIWVCDYLWNKTYVHVEGEVRPCCVVGPPVLGNLETQSFTEIWDGPAYRAMRQHLAARSPVGVCKGCQFIREVGDPKRADELLQGMSAPRPDELLPIPPELLATPAPIPSGS